MWIRIRMETDADRYRYGTRGRNATVSVPTCHIDRLPTDTLQGVTLHNFLQNAVI